MLVGAVVWTALSLVAAPPAARRSAAVAVPALACVVARRGDAGLGDGRVRRRRAPEERLSRAVGALAGADVRRRRRRRRRGDGDRRRATSCAGATPPTSAAPASGCSTSWSGAASTSPPTSTSTSRSPSTGSRPRAEADAQIHLATGGYVDALAPVPDAVEVATYDPRTDAGARRVRRGARPASSTGSARGARRPRASWSTPTCSACRSTRASRRPTTPTSPADRARPADGRVHRPARRRCRGLAHGIERSRRAR